MRNPRDVALELLNRVFNGGAYANLLLPALLREVKLEKRDAALAQELGFGTIRMKALLDAVIVKASSRKLSDIEDNALQILELGCYQILFTRIPDHASINETVELAKRSGSGRASSFVNAVLRKVAAKKIEHWFDEIANGLGEMQKLALRTSHPDWIVQALKMALLADNRVDDLEKLLIADNTPAPVNLVALPGISKPADVAELARSSASPTGYILSSGDPGALDSVRAGHLRVQDAGSQLVALALAAAKPVAHGEDWLDLCAGPGGKAVLLAALAEQNACRLTANEISPQRAKLVADALRSSKLSARVQTEDGRRVTGQYDRILVDAPCTGLGALRRRPEARWQKQSSDVTGLVELQTALLARAWQLVKPGGIVLYATCSPHVAETTGVVDTLLRSENFNGVLLNANDILLGMQPNLDLPSNRRTAQLWPHLHETDAMFLAIFQKPIT